MYLFIYIYLYTHIHTCSMLSCRCSLAHRLAGTANLCTTKILDFGGLDPSRVLILRGGILRYMGDFPESLSQRIVA